MRLAEVRLQDGESLENALRRFKREVQAEDIIREVKRHSYYLKPGERRECQNKKGPIIFAGEISRRKEKYRTRTQDRLFANFVAARFLPFARVK